MTPVLFSQLEKLAGFRLRVPSAAAVGNAAKTVGTKLKQTGKFMLGAHDTSTPSGIGPNQPRVGVGGVIKGIIAPDIPFLDRPRMPPGPPGSTFGSFGQAVATPLRSLGRDVRDTLRIGGDALRHIPYVGKHLGVNDGRVLGNLRQGLSASSRLVAGVPGGIVGAGIGAANAAAALPSGIASAFQNWGASPEEVQQLRDHINKVGPGKLTWDLMGMMYNPQDPLSEAVGDAAQRLSTSRLASNMLTARTEGENAPYLKALDIARAVRSPFGALSTAGKEWLMHFGSPTLGIDAPRLGADGKVLASAQDSEMLKATLDELKAKLPGALRDPGAISSPAVSFMKTLVPEDLAKRQAGNFAAAAAKPQIDATASQLAEAVPDFTNIGTAGGLAVGAGAGLGLYGLYNLASKKKKKNRLAKALAAVGIGGLVGAGIGRFGGNWLASQSSLPEGVDWQGAVTGALGNKVDDVLRTGRLPSAGSVAAAGPAAAAGAAPAAAAGPAAAPAPYSPLQTAISDKVHQVGDSAVRDIAQQRMGDFYHMSPNELVQKYPGIQSLLQQAADAIEKRNSYTPYLAASIGVPTALGALVSAYRAKKKSRFISGAQGGALGFGTGVGAVGGGLLGGAAGAGIAALTSVGGGVQPEEAMRRILGGMTAGGVTGAGAGGYAGYRTMHELMDEE